MSESDNKEYPCIYDETPLHHERHPNNYLAIIGQILFRFRKSFPREERSAEKFGAKTLGKYFGRPANRERISKAENGDPTVAFGVIAAYLNEMGVLPDVIKAIDTGSASNFRYLALLEKEIAPEIQDAIDIAQVNLNKKVQMELCRE